MIGNRILIVDGNTDRRQALSAALQQDQTLELVGNAETGRQGVVELLKSYPDIVLISHELPDIIGTETARAMVHLVPAVRIILITPPLKGDRLIRAVAAGVRDYVDENAPSEDIVALLRETVTGKYTFSPGFMDALISALQAQAAVSG